MALGTNERNIHGAPFTPQELRCASYILSGRLIGVIGERIPKVGTEPEAAEATQGAQEERAASPLTGGGERGFLAQAAARFWKLLRTERNTRDGGDTVESGHRAGTVNPRVRRLVDSRIADALQRVTIPFQLDAVFAIRQRLLAMLSDTGSVDRYFSSSRLTGGTMDTPLATWQVAGEALGMSPEQLFGELRMDTTECAAKAVREIAGLRRLFRVKALPILAMIHDRPPALRLASLQEVQSPRRIITT